MEKQQEMIRKMGDNFEQDNKFESVGLYLLEVSHWQSRTSKVRAKLIHVGAFLDAILQLLNFMHTPYLNMKSYHC